MILVSEADRDRIKETSRARDSAEAGSSLQGRNRRADLYAGLGSKRSESPLGPSRAQKLAGYFEGAIDLFIW